MPLQELLIALGALAGSVYFLLVVKSFSFLESYNPGYWPGIILTGMIVCSLFILKDAIVNIRKSESKESNTSPFAKNFWITVAALGLYIALSDFLGFVTCTILFSLIMLWMLKSERAIPFVITTLIVSVGFTFFFTKYLEVPLPRGIGLFEVMSRVLY